VSNKIDLEVRKGSSYNNSNTYSLKYNIKNNDATGISLSAVRVVTYGWLQDNNPTSHFTSGINFIGDIRTFNEVPLSGVSTQNGIEPLYIGQNSYLINHDTIDSSKVAPQITLIVPTGGSEIGPISITNRTNTSFTIVLPDTPTTSGYEVAWLIPNHYTEYETLSQMTGTISASFEKLSIPAIREDGKLATHKIIFNHSTSSVLNPGQGLFDTDVYLQYYKLFFQNSDLVSWYTDLTDSYTSNNTLILETYNGSSWTPVTEYTESGIDINTGKEPSSKNTIVISPTVLTSADRAVYICSDNINPIDNSSIDMDDLKIRSNFGSGIKRSLISFDTSAIPLSAETIINSYLRLNVNGATSAFNYTLADGTISVHRILSSWKENEVSWTKRDNSNNWSSVGGDISSELDVWRANSSITNFTSGSGNDFYIDLNVTEAVQYWKDNPSDNHGLLLKLTPTSNESSSTEVEFIINSFRNDTTDTTPTLIVAYDDQTSVHIPVGEITTPTAGNVLSSPQFNISAIASVDQGSIFNVVLQYKKQTETIYQNLIGLEKENNVWGITTSPLTPDTYDLRLRMMSNDGVIGYSDSITITYQTSGDIFITQTSAIGSTSTVEIPGYTTTLSNPVSGYIEYQYDYIPLSATVYKIVNDIYSSNVVWVSTNNGIYRTDKTNLVSPVTRFGLAEGLVDSFSNALYVDSLGYVWAGTSEGAESKLYRFRSNFWDDSSNLDIRTFTRYNSSLSNWNSSVEIHEIIEANNKLYFTNKNNSKVFVTSDRDLQTSYDIVTLTNIPKSISQNNSIVYFGSYSSGLETLTSANVLSSISLAIDNINSIAFDSNNNIWLATEEKIYCRTSAGTLQDVSAINSNNIGEATNIVISGSSKYFFFKNKGIAKYTGVDFTSAQAISGSNWTVYDTTNSLIPSNNLTYGQVNNSTWLSTDNGVFNFDTSAFSYSKTNAVIRKEITVAGNTFTTDWPTTDTGNLKLKANITLQNGEEIFKNFDYLIVPVPVLSVNINDNHFIDYSPLVSVSAFSVNVSNVLGNYTTKIYSSKTINGIYTEKVSSANLPFVSYSDIFPVRETIYIKAIVTDTYGNIVDSGSYKVTIGDAPLLYNIAATSVNYATYSPLTISGNISGDIQPRTIIFYAVNEDTTETLLGTEDSPIASFNFIWSPNIIDGTVSIKIVAVYDTGLVQTYNLNIPRITSGPTISILNNGFYPNNSNLILSANISHISGVSNATAYSNNNLLTTLTLSGGFWVGSFATSSISTSAGGNFNILVSSTSNGGYVNSNSSQISINSLPTYTSLNDYYVYGSPIKLSGTIGDVEGYIETRVDILSADINWNSLGYLTSAQSDIVGKVIHTLPTISAGAHNLLVKTYDRNPGASSDFSLTRLPVYSNDISSQLILSGGILTSINFEPVYSILSNTSVTLSANIVSQISVSANFWEVVFDGSEYTKVRLITTDSTAPYTTSAIFDSSRILNGATSEYILRGVLLELVDSVGNITPANVIKIHATDLSSTFEITNGSLCSVSATYSGTIKNSNFPRFGSPLITSNLSVSILDSADLTISAVSYYRGDSEDFLFAINIPLSSVSGNTNLKLKLQDTNGLVYINTLNTGLINGNPVTSNLSISGDVLYTSGSIYITSGNFNVSGSASTVGIKEYKLIVNSVNGQEIYFADSSSIANIVIEDGYEYTIYGEVKTNGGCDSVTPTIKVISKSAGISEIYPSSCISCYCDSSSLNVYGFVGDNDLQYYLSNNLGNTLSATVSDGVGVINNLTSATQLLSAGNYFSEYSFEWLSPRVGTSALYLRLFDSYGFDKTTKIELPKTISNGVSATLNLPLAEDTNEIYSSSLIPFSINLTSGSVASVRYYVNGALVGSSTNSSNNFLFNWSSPGLNGNIIVKAIILDVTGCYTQLPNRTIAVSDGVVINIIDPDNNSYVGKNISNTFKSAVIDSLNIVSAVNYYWFDQSISATKVDTYNSNISLSASTMVSAIAFASNNTSAYNEVYINVAEISAVNMTIDGLTSAIYTQPDEILFGISANINSVSNLTATIQKKNGLVWENLITPNKLTSSTFSITTLNHTLNSGVNEIRTLMIDQLGNSATSNIVSATNSYGTVNLSNPSIKVISNTPIEKISKTSISTVFEVVDYNNGIFVDSIKLTSASVGTITTIEAIVPGKKYNVTVAVNKSGSVSISASNLINRTTTLRVDNYIIKCSDGRELNLTNYLPLNDQYDYYGNDSEFKQFTKFFEDYLNTMYTNTEESCSLSVLEKINKLTSLHDIDTVEQKYIPYLSNMLGYDINFDKNSIGQFGGVNLGLSGTDLESYKDKVLRFVVSNLPNWYSIKTTRNSMKIMLLSFGLVGDIIEVYTLDYDKEWKLNKVTDNDIVGDDIGTDWYPTPHMSIGINLNESNISVVNTMSLRDDILEAMESIRPANVVVDSLLGYAETKLPDSLITIKFQSTKNINITSASQLN